MLRRPWHPGGDRAGVPAGADHGNDDALLEVVGVTLRYGGVTALDNVSLRVGARECVGVIGPNGAGKSTLVHVISGGVRARAGTVRLAGRDIGGRGAYRRAHLGIARTFQNLQLSSRLTVGENVRIAVEVGHGRRAKRDGPAGRTIRDVYEAVLAQFDLSDYRDLAVLRAPYGVQKRAEAARAVALRPDLLILDEPVAGLNTAEKAEFVSTLRDVIAAQRCAVLLIEHDMSVISDLTDRVYVMDSGAVIAEGTFGDVRQLPQVRSVYLGTAGGAGA